MYPFKMTNLTRRQFLSSAAAAGSWRATQAARRPSGRSQAPPNILWLMTDEHRTDSLGCYGSPWAQTPHLDRLAERGILFRQAVTPSPVCVPARVSLLTGRYPAATGVLCNLHQPPEQEQHWLTDELVRHGYQSASFGKSHYRAERKAFQTEGGKVLTEAVHYFRYRDKYRMEDYQVVRYPGKPYPWILAGRFPEPAERTAAYLNVSEALNWCRGLDRKRPFLLRLSFNEPHTPYVVPPPYDTLIPAGRIHLAGPDRLPADAPVWDREGLAPIQSSELLQEGEILRMRQVYYGLVSFLDSQIGRLLQEMDRMGLLENTIVALLADHGTHLADHGLVQKQSFYQASVQVPFLMSWPGRIPAGVVLEEPVETLSLLPTLLELGGFSIPERVQGRSLALALLEGREAGIGPVFSEIDLANWGFRPGERIIMIRDGRWKMSVYRQPDAPAGTPCPDGALYDLQADPSERVNLYDNDSSQGVVRQLLAKIEERDRKVAFPRPAG